MSEDEKNRQIKTGGLFKIGELARAADTSLSTVKFYVKEGLVRPVCKTGRNMAYYDPSAATTIRRIRMLQRERFYPLSVIKRLLASGADDALDLELLDAIHKFDPETDARLVSAGEAAKRTGLTPSQITALVQGGLIHSDADGRKHEFSASDLGIMTLIRRRMDAGIPFEQSARAFAIYERALREAAAADVDSFVAGALMVRDFTADTGARMIRVSDETLDAFVALKRKELNREYGARRIDDLSRFETALTSALPRLAEVLRTSGFPDEAALCRSALEGKPADCAETDAATARYWGFVRDAGGDIAQSIAQSVHSRAWFASHRPERGRGGLAAHCLRVCWLTLAPAVLECAEAAREARADFASYAHGLPGGDAVSDAVLNVLDHMRGE